MNVTVIHLMSTLMERQLDESAGWLLKSALEARGQTILAGTDTECIVREDRVEAVKLKDGSIIPASLAVIPVGIRPHTAPAQDTVLAAGPGIHVDATMGPPHPVVTAIGECVGHMGP